MASLHFHARTLTALVGVALLLTGCDQFPNPLTGAAAGSASPIPPAARGEPGGPDVVTQSYDLRQIGLNVGTATAQDFLVDPLPYYDTNPFGAAETILTRRCELALFNPAELSTSTAGDFRVLEDEITGESPVTGAGSSNGFGWRIRATVVADIDGDAADEIIVASTVSGGLILHRVDRDAAGEYVWTEIRRVDNMGFPAADAELVAGDFDGDKRDEIAVVGLRFGREVDGNSAAIRVVNDPMDGAGYLLDRQIASNPLITSIGNFVRYSCAAGDVNGDGFDDLILGRQGEGQFSLHRNAFRMSLYLGAADAAQLSLQIEEQLIHSDLGNILLSGASKMTVGQFDTDPDDEIMVASARGVEGAASFYFRQLDLNAAQTAFVLSHGSQFSGACLTAPSLPESFAACAVDRFGTGDDEFAFFRKPTGSQSSVRLIRWDAGIQSWSSEEVFRDVGSYTVDALTLTAGDSDADGAEELFASYCWGTTSSKRNWVYAIEDGSAPTNRRIADYTTTAAGATRALQMLPGDFDSDGFEIRYTGLRELVVSNPVPITLMAAVPTKAGITQNTGLSGTSYRVGIGSGIETSLSTSSTITAKVGTEIEDITGMFGGSAKATMERETRSTETTSTRITEITGYSSAYDADVIIFAAHMYLTHEYEIVSAPIPTLIGDRFTLDQPIGTNVYKWTVPFYNATVPAAYAIGPDLLPHTIGAPQTYRTDAEMNGVSGPVVSWKTTSPIPVGQGGGVNSSEIDLSTENTSTQQREVDLGGETSFKAYGVSVEGSFSTGTGSAYSVSTNESTQFEGVVGDINDPAEYLDWRFDWGMHVYQPWRLSDSNNEPTGAWIPGGYPLTVIDFWTNPMGDGY